MTTRNGSNGYALATLAADLSAGLVVFLVALPLCLGIALASNAPLFSGILAGIVGGILVGPLSGSHTSVSGPAAGLTAVVIAQIAAVGSYEGFLVAVLIAGLLQLLLGAMRAGSIADFVPSSVIKGLLAAIGLILILKQIPHLLGYDADPIGEMSFYQPDRENTFSELLRMFLHFNWGAAMIGVLSIALLTFWERSKLKSLRLPGALVVVLAGVGCNFLFAATGSDLTVGASHLVQVPVAETLAGFFGFLQMPDFTVLSKPAVYTAGVTIALVASLETLLNLEAVDKLDPQRRTSPPNRELLAQGVGNVVAGLIGALPVTSVIVRSSVNINTGAKTKLSAIFHGVLLVLCVAFLPTWLNLIPLASLAAILILTGLKLASPRVFRQMWQAGYEQFLPFVVTVAAILFTDLLMGILIGLGFSVLFILRSNLRRPLNRTLENHIGGEVLHIELGNQVSFLNRVALRNALFEAPRGGHVLIDARSSDYIDSDILSVIREFADETAPARGVQVSLVGFKPHYAQIEDRVRYVDLATRELQESLTPEQVVQILREGNERYRTGQPLTRDVAHLREQAAKERHPLAVILSGSSSRTPVEMLFDAGMGEIFCVRATGNAAFAGTLGSLEYACAVAGAKTILVLGHTDNKAVRMAVESVFQPPSADDGRQCVNLEPILDEIRTSVDRVRIEDWASAPAHVQDAWVDDISRAHVRRTMDRILQQSPVLARLARERRIALVGGIYDIRSGAVDIFDPDGSEVPGLSRHGNGKARDGHRGANAPAALTDAEGRDSKAS
jgi:carbonic anhydrase/SulP family sulfate permease